MTKRSLLKWLNIQKEKALRAADDEHDKVYANRKAAIYLRLGLKEVADEIQEHMTKAAKVWDAWKKLPEVKESLDTTYNYSSHPDYMFNNYTGQEDRAYKKLTIDVLRLDSKELEQLAKNQKIEWEKIRDTYNNVIMVTEGMATAKEAATYLTSLGFDLTEIDNPPAPVTALAIQIDPHYLFIKKAEKAA